MSDQYLTANQLFRVSQYFLSFIISRRAGGIVKCNKKSLDSTKMDAVTATHLQPLTSVQKASKPVCFVQAVLLGQQDIIRGDHTLKITASTHPTAEKPDDAVSTTKLFLQRVGFLMERNFSPSVRKNIIDNDDEDDDEDDEDDDDDNDSMKTHMAVLTQLVSLEKKMKKDVVADAMVHRTYALQFCYLLMKDRRATRQSVRVSMEKSTTQLLVRTIVLLRQLKRILTDYDQELQVFKGLKTPQIQVPDWYLWTTTCLEPNRLPDTVFTAAKINQIRRLLCELGALVGVW